VMPSNDAETFVGKSIKMIMLEGVLAGHFGECGIHFIVLRCSYFEGVELHLGEKNQVHFLLLSCTFK